MKIRILFPFLFLSLVIFINQLHAKNLPEFFEELYEKHKTEYKELKTKEFNNFCARYQVNNKNEDNKDKFSKIHFFHDLFTGESAEDCTYAGVFEIRYFWHWVNPNPRHEIKRLPGKNSLDDIKPPKRFSRYKNYASIDRVPSLFLGDLVSDTPGYFHEECGEFYTFGWCSEREMAFTSLMSFFGFEGKIKQEEIHVWSMFWVPFIDISGKEIYRIAMVDNTFDLINWEIPSRRITKKTWMNKIGSGQTIEWYNKKARSPKEKDFVSKIIVSATAQRRLTEQIEKFFK